MHEEKREALRKQLDDAVVVGMQIAELYKGQDRVRAARRYVDRVLGFDVVVDGRVPRDEIQLQDEEGNVLSRITGIQQDG